MPGDRTTSSWHVIPPAVWPEPPPLMSYSTLSDLEACPRRWALSAAEYPRVWDECGYPRPLQQAQVEGTIIHLSLQKITRALIERRCPSLFDESAISTLRELGGYTAIVLSSLERALQPYDRNPRAAPVLNEIRYRLTAQIPAFRSKIQRLLTRIQPEKRLSGGSVNTDGRVEGESRSQLVHGSYAEIELRAIALGWRGFADLLTLSSAQCEIRDFKTGAPKQDHEFQIRTYALLWARDRDLNPNGRLADRLVLSYDEGDTEIPAPSKEEIRRLEEELRRRTADALATFRTDLPEARPSPQNCECCPVRHLCEEYWQSNARQGTSNESAENGFGDVQIGLTGQHGPNSWDGVIESGPDLKIGGPILLRTTNHQFALKPSQRVRLLNVHIRVPEKDPIEEKQPIFVATMGANSEAFLLS